MDIMIGLAVSLCVFAGAIGGMHLYRLLPRHHLSSESREVVRLSINMVSILAAVVLGLLIASAKGVFDRADLQIRSYSADLTILDQTLRRYGQEADPIRANLLRYTERAVRATWPDPGVDSQPLEDKAAGELLNQIVDQVLDLAPQTPTQTWLRARAMDTSAKLIQTRWMVLINQAGSTNPVLLIILVGWITFAFATFGLNAPRNATVVAAFLASALSIGTSVYLILAIETPFDGTIMVSGDPMKSALDHIKSPNGPMLISNSDGDALATPAPGTKR
jgi:hypothetical protein